MYISSGYTLVFVAVFFTVTTADWEVLNDDSSAESDNFLQRELLLPADEVARQEMAKVKHIVSLESNGKNRKPLTTQDSSPQKPSSKSSDSSKAAISKDNNGVVLMTSKQKSTNQAKASAASGSVQNGASAVNEVNLADEGFLLADTDQKKALGARKLAQIDETDSSEPSERTLRAQKRTPNVEVMSQNHNNRKESVVSRPETQDDHSIEAVLSSEHLLPAQSSEGQNPSNSQKKKKKKKKVPEPAALKETLVETSAKGQRGRELQMDLLEDLRRACLDPDSWDCKMFQGDYTTMRQSNNLSHDSQVNHRSRRETFAREHNRVKRQTSTGGELQYNTKKDLSYTFTSVFRNIPGPLTPELENRVRSDIQAQLITLHQISNVPGFEGIEITNVEFVGNELQVTWTAFIMGDSVDFFSLNTDETTQAIEDSLINVDNNYQSTLLVEGQQPEDTYSATTETSKITAQTSDPCQDACPLGYQCEVVVPGEQLVTCTSNCLRTCGTSPCIIDPLTGGASCTLAEECQGLDCGSGDGLYTDTQTIDSPQLSLSSQSTFEATPYTDTNQPTESEKTNLGQEIKKQLEELFKDVKGFKDVTITDVGVKNGNLVFNWVATIDADPEFRGETPDSIKDRLNMALKNLTDSYNNGLDLGGKKPILPFDLTDAVNQIKEQVDNPCKFNPCSAAYDKCQLQNPGGSVGVVCTHKCITSGLNALCQHGSLCEIIDSNPLCQCSKNWEGEYCEVASTTYDPTALDGGEITGIVIGGVLTVAGVLGCCCWFLLCFRRNRDMQFTHYTDEEGSGSFNSPSTKLHPYVIDRPHVSRNPIQVFRPTPTNSTGSGFGSSSANYSRRSSLGTSDSGGRRAKR